MMNHMCGSTDERAEYVNAVIDATYDAVRDENAPQPVKDANAMLLGYFYAARDLDAAVRAARHLDKVLENAETRDRTVQVPTSPVLADERADDAKAFATV